MYDILSEDASKFMTVLNAYLLDEVQEKTSLHMALNDFFMLFYWMMEHQQMCRTCNAVSTNMEGGYSFLLQITSNHFNEQKDCTLRELFQVYQECSFLEEYKCKKCSMRSEAVETDKIVTLPSILCVVVSCNINHEGRPISINSPVDYPVDELHGANIIFDGHMNNDGHSYRLFGVINYKSTGSDTGHYTAICKSKDSCDWFEYNDGDVWKSEFCKHNGGPKEAPYQRLVAILFYEETGISDSNYVLSKQAQSGMQSTTTSVGHLPDAMLIDGKNLTTLKDDESFSTLSTHDCSHDGAPSAAFNDGWTTFEEWNYNKRPSYQISDYLFNKMTCTICIKEVFTRFTSTGELSGCKHDFCYRCIWKWENTTIIEGNWFRGSICRTVWTPIAWFKEINSTNIPKNI